MNGRTVLFIFALRRRRRAFALGEALILMIVVLITLGGIFSSIGYSMRLRGAAQTDLDSFLTAEAWFDALEAESSEKIGSQSALIAAAREVIEHLGGGTVGKDRFSVGGTILTPVFRGTRDGVHQIELKVDRPEMRNCGTVAFLRSFNSKSSNTVQDNVYKRRAK